MCAFAFVLCAFVNCREKSVGHIPTIRTPRSPIGDGGVGLGERHTNKYRIKRKQNGTRVGVCVCVFENVEGAPTRSDDDCFAGV